MISYLSKADKNALKGTALLRLDFNAEDEWRMMAALPTVNFLLKHSDKIIILSHRGRPKGFEKDLSLKKDADYLGKLLKRKIVFVRDLDLPAIRQKVTGSRKGSVFLLENLRFFKGEAENDEKFARELASLGDFYVNDAFAVSHRKNASISAITQFLPSFAGLELEMEVKFLSSVMLKVRKPMVIILGGAKAHDKLGVIEFFKKKADWFLIGGASGNTMLSISGVDIKKSLASNNEGDIKNLRRILKYKNVVIPSDVKFKEEAILDIGKQTVEIFAEKIKSAKTIIWSGPMGAFEKKGFSEGTLAVAKAIVANKKAFSLVGGGETVTFLEERGFDKKFSFISTGGGAMLEFLAGKKLPGIAALEK